MSLRAARLVAFVVLALGAAGRVAAQDGPAADGAGERPEDLEVLKDEKVDEPVRFCPKCNRQPKPDARYCVFAHDASAPTPLEILDAHPQSECTHCYRFGEPNDDYCRFDGHRMKKAAFTPEQQNARRRIFEERGGGALGEELWETAGKHFDAAAELAPLGQRGPLRARAAYARGRMHLAAGRLDRAVVELLLAASLDANAADVFFALGETYAQAGDASNAVRAFDRAIELAPDDPRAHTGRGGALAGLGETERALADLARAMELAKPDDPDPWVRRAVIHLNAGRPRDAVRDLDEAIARDPDSADHYLVCGTARQAIGGTEGLSRAVEDFDRAIEVDPKRADAHFRRGLALARLGETARAETAFAVAVGLDPELFPVILKLTGDEPTGPTDPRLPLARAAVEGARTFAREGKWNDVVRSLLIAIHYVPDEASTHKLLGDALARVGRTADAIAAYREALRLAPNLVEARFARGFLHASAGHDAEAEADFDAVLERFPKHPLALNARGEVRYRTDRHAEAKADFDAAIEADPKFSVAYYNRALALKKLATGADEARFIAEAREDLYRALFLDPFDAKAHVQNGLLAFRVGDHRAARDAFRLAAELLPNDPLVHYDLGLALEYGRDGDRWVRRGGDYDRDAAIAAYRRARNLDPRHAAAALNLGILEIEAGEHARAATSLRAAQRVAESQADQKDLAVSAAYHLGIALEHDSEGRRRSSGANLQGAIDAYDDALRLDSRHFEARLNRALVKLARGEDGAAHEELAALHSRDRQNLDVLLNLALARRYLGRDDADPLLTEYRRLGGDAELARRVGAVRAR